MPEVSGNTLVMAIQAVDGEIQRLSELPDEQMVPEDYLLLEAYLKSADELELAYAEALQHAINLPPYAQLVRGDAGKGQS